MKFIKNFGLKKIIKKSLAKYQQGAMPDAVAIVGLLTDEKHFKYRDAIVQELVKQGIAEKNIEVLSFRERLNSKEAVAGCYTLGDINANGSFKKEETTAFIYRRFDMLISYYDEESLPLMLATLKSKAKFKVGFPVMGNNLNDFTINTDPQKHEVFISELFKYLKILNKI
ncbi:hypothetical protein GWA97_11650 [Flavobacterium sp. LaA7.5]|nr:hypothetical protein [Flavobacterium salilacus subsp. altitudinum]